MYHFFPISANKIFSKFFRICSKKEGYWLILNTKRDSSHPLGMTNDGYHLNKSGEE